MAVEKGINPFSWVAGADLSALQYRFVKMGTTAGQVVIGTAGAVCIGVLQNDPTSGRGAAVQTLAGTVTKIGASTTGSAGIAANDPIRSGANGIAIEASTGGTAYVAARAVEALSSGSTGIISIMLTHEGPTSTA
jgi:hypothetical protein